MSEKANNLLTLIIRMRPRDSGTAHETVSVEHLVVQVLILQVVLGFLFLRFRDVVGETLGVGTVPVGDLVLCGSGAPYGLGDVLFC